MTLTPTLYQARRGVERMSASRAASTANKSAERLQRALLRYVQNAYHERDQEEGNNENQPVLNSLSVISQGLKDATIRRPGPEPKETIASQGPGEEVRAAMRRRCQATGKHVTAGTVELMPIYRVLEDVWEKLQWVQNPAYVRAAPPFLDAYSTCYLSDHRSWAGEGSWMVTNDCKMGLFLLGPGHSYPCHTHSTSEFYVVLSGKALWRRGEEDWVEREVGDQILHRGDQVHEMRTLDEPLLALWFWTGHEIESPSTSGRSIDVDKLTRSRL